MLSSIWKQHCIQLLNECVTAGETLFKITNIASFALTNKSSSCKLNSHPTAPHLPIQAGKGGSNFNTSLQESLGLKKQFLFPYCRFTGKI